MSEWRPVVGHEGRYEVTYCGLVRSLSRAGTPRRILRGSSDADGYRRVTLARPGGQISRKVHVLVAEAFIGPKPWEGAEVCHADNSRTNNRVANLRWDTRAGNARDSSRLSLDDTQTIVALYRAGTYNQQELANMFGVSFQHVSDIVRGRRWPGIAAPAERRSYVRANQVGVA